MFESTMKKLLLSSAALTLSACAGAFNGPEHALTVAEEHPISVDSQVVTMTLDVDSTVSELSSLDKARVRAFADAYLNQGHGPLTVTTPSGTSGDFDGKEKSADIREALNDAGVPWSSISGAAYRAGGEGDGKQVILSYTHYVATPSECGVWSGLRARDYRNMRSPNYGCATQNNIAAMLADPHDLVAPAALSPRDAAAVTRGYNLFRDGEITSSERDSEIETEVSE
ncbi:MAG: CpaD family pilus assembly lipoprotein [Marinicaulis sp.]|nr:CpaD family pilus assembly lipoprotein [Marinicaulis sp.]